jgi:glycosyltransferase involved in cell wall biosynthesis
MREETRATIPPVAEGVARPTWSVMIPTYNCAGFLGQTLRSVLAQDPGAAEMQIEVVDDASQDDPARIVEELGGGRIGFHRQPRNVGHIANFRTCLERSRGHLVHLLHGDDHVLPGFYAALKRGFASDPAIGAAFCRYMLVNEAGDHVAVATPEQPEPGRLADSLARLAVEQRIVTPSIAVRRSVYEALGGFDARLACSEDWEMWVRIAARYPIWYEPQALAAYRVHANSNTGRHYRFAEELRYTAKAIEMFSPYLPAERARSIARQARINYAHSALRNAERMALLDDRPGMRAHMAAALRLSWSSSVLRRTSRLLVKVIR